MLLLLLRATALGLLVLAFTRPFLRRAARLDSGDVERRRIAVLIDTSASMRRGDLWPRAKALADRVIAGCRPADQLALFSFDASSRPLLGFATANDPLGPWTDDFAQHGPYVLKGLPGQVIGPGHNSVVLGPDDQTLYVVYHAWDAGKTARRLCIDPLIWTHDGPRCDGPSYQPREM